MGFIFFQTATILGPVAGGLIYGLAASPAPVYVCATVAYLIAVMLLSAIRLNIAARARLEEPISVVLDGLRYILAQQVDSRLHVARPLQQCCWAARLLGRRCIRARSCTRVPMDWECYARPLAWVLSWLRLSLRTIPCGDGPVGDADCIGGFGVFTIVFGLAHSFALSLIALILTGAFDMVSVIVRSTLVQLKTPDEMRGRVSAVNMLLIGASTKWGSSNPGSRRNGSAQFRQ